MSSKNYETNGCGSDLEIGNELVLIVVCVLQPTRAGCRAKSDHLTRASLSHLAGTIYNPLSINIRL
jgi:hypothetical protein